MHFGIGFVGVLLFTLRFESDTLSCYRLKKVTMKQERKYADDVSHGLLL